MDKIKNLTKQLIIISSIALITQMTFASGAFALDPITPQGTSGDLSLTIMTAAKDRAFAITVCNNGTDPIIEFTLDIDTTNYEAKNFFPLPPGFAGANPTDNGTYDSDTGIWNGQILATECVALGAIGDVTGEVGETISMTATLVSSVLEDSTPNVDPTPGNDTDTYTTSPIVLDPDLTLSTRLLTSGAISSGSPVAYEMTISNIGLGDFIDNPGRMPFGIYFIIPDGTTFVDVVDQDLGDNIDITTCSSQGSASVLPAFAGITAELVGCQLAISPGNFPAGESFKLTFNMTASGPFSTGSSKALAVTIGDDADSLLIQTLLFTPGADPFGLDTNNLETLTYDGTALAATINPCSGTSTVTTINDACFKVSFNKPIYEDSFTIDSLVLTGPGSIYSFSKTGDNEWTVRLNQLVSGQVTTLSIDLDEVLDYSAVQVSQVLGINTIRYDDVTNAGAGAGAAATGASAGTLPSTGSHSWYVSLFALILLAFGLSLHQGSKKLNVTKSES